MVPIPTMMLEPEILFHKLRAKSTTPWTNTQSRHLESKFLL